MRSLLVVSSAVQEALQSKQIGAPVFVRLVMHSLEDHGKIETALAVALKTAAGWLGDKVRRLSAAGGVSTGQITALAECFGGQSALVSVATRGSAQGSLEALVIGNRGILSWEPAGRDVAGRDAEAPKLNDEAAKFIQAVRKSLAVKRTVNVETASSNEQPPKGPESPRRKSTPPSYRKQKPPFGVLLVAGNHTHQENYARAFAADKRARLIGLADETSAPRRRRELNKALAEELKIPLFATLKEGLDRPDVHVVSVCAEPDRRARIIVRCAEAKKHLYLDKPLAASAKEAGQIAAAVREAGVLSQMFSLVRSPAAVRLRETLKSGKLGTPIALHFDLTFAKGYTGTADLEKPRKETVMPKQLETFDSKREMSNVGVYPLVLLLWLLDKRVTHVRAATGNYFFAEHQKNNMEDFGALLLTLEGGVTASIAAGRTGWRSHPLGGLNRNHVVGEKGVAAVDLHRPRLEVWADQDPWTPPERNPEDPMGFWSSTTKAAGGKTKDAWITPPVEVQSDVGYFLDCLEQGRESDVSAQLAADTTRILMAAYESAALGDVSLVAH